jgi:outer membrane protein
VAALHAAIAAQRQLARVQAAAGYPHLGVFAGADYAMPNRYVVPPTSDFEPSWEVGALLSYAPNDTLTAARRGRESRAQIEVLEADLEELERGLVLEVRQARAASTRAVRSAEAARATQRATAQAYEQRLAQLRAGEVTSADLFAAESELNRARLDVLDAAVEQRLAQTRLAYAIGE